ncbi:hypothetical protein ACERIT_08845 [Halopenitus sp. H-Gu1]|uniref:hypothetical protein n=1 Tax=Halopenitus sp. H-Gu1 TaxID=3242697 RepID=UPI00359CEBDA
MSYQHADSDEAQRIWTKRITGNILIAEYDDGDYLIYNNNKSRSLGDGLILEPPQMQELLDFADNVEISDEALLGEDFHNGELVVRYQDGSYTLDPSDLDTNMTLSEKQIDDLDSLMERMELIMEDYHKLIEMQEKQRSG